MAKFPIGARLDAKLSDPAAPKFSNPVALKPFIKSEAEAAVKRGRMAKKLLEVLPPSAGGRKKKYVSEIAVAEQIIDEIKAGTTAPPPSGELAEFLRIVFPNATKAMRKTLRNKLTAKYRAALRARAECPEQS